jgi:hypothetical protein
VPGEQEMLSKSHKPRRKRPNRKKFGPKNPVTSAKTKSRFPKNQEKNRFLRVKPAEKIRPASENPAGRSTIGREVFPRSRRIKSQSWKNEKIAPKKIEPHKSLKGRTNPKHA